MGSDPEEPILIAWGYFYFPDKSDFDPPPPSFFCCFFFSSTKTISWRSRKLIIIVIVWQEQWFMNNRMPKEKRKKKANTSMHSSFLKRSDPNDQSWVSSRESYAKRGRDRFWNGLGCRCFLRAGAKRTNLSPLTSMLSVLRGPLTPRCQGGKPPESIPSTALAIAVQLLQNPLCSHVK